MVNHGHDDCFVESSSFYSDSRDDYTVPNDIHAAFMEAPPVPEGSEN